MRPKKSSIFYFETSKYADRIFTYVWIKNDREFYSTDDDDCVRLFRAN